MFREMGNNCFVGINECRVNFCEADVMCTGKIDRERYRLIYSTHTVHDATSKIKM